MTSREAAMHTLRAALKPAHDAVELRRYRDQLERDKAALVEALTTCITALEYSEAYWQGRLRPENQSVEIMCSDARLPARALLARLEKEPKP